MDIMEPPTITCTKCLSALSSRATGRFCPVCLLEQALYEHPLREKGEQPKACLDEDYELLEVIGRGSVGTVYRAWQRSREQSVAVKVLTEGAWASEEALARFRREGMVGAALHHSRLVTIHAMGEQNGRLYLVMDLVDGPNLQAWIHDGGVEERRAATTLRCVADAVEHMHQQGALHRDLKPSNIVLNASGEPFVTDFGLVKLLEDDDGPTLTGTTLGTPGFIAPEQAYALSARSAKKTLGPWSDVYALGAILYALLVGHPPYQGDTLKETILGHLQGTLTPPHRYRPEVSRQLEAICLKCLEREPSQRYSTARDLARALDRFLAVGAEPSAGQPSDHHSDREGHRSNTC